MNLKNYNKFKELKEKGNFKYKKNLKLKDLADTVKKDIGLFFDSRDMFYDRFINRIYIENIPEKKIKKAIKKHKIKDLNYSDILVYIDISDWTFYGDFLITNKKIYGKTTKFFSISFRQAEGIYLHPEKLNLGTILTIIPILGNKQITIDCHDIPQYFIYIYLDYIIKNNY